MKTGDKTVFLVISGGVPASPILPKRSARMELDAINNKRPFSQKEKLPEVPELESGMIHPDEQKIDIGTR